MEDVNVDIAWMRRSLLLMTSTEALHTSITALGRRSAAPIMPCANMPAMRFMTEVLGLVLSAYNSVQAILSPRVLKHSCMAFRQAGGRCPNMWRELFIEDER